MSSKERILSFKYTYPIQTRILQTKGTIENPQTKDFKEGYCQWDTGATHSCINEDISSYFS